MCVKINSINGKGDFMELLNKFPNGFFGKDRPEAPKKKNDILPIRWSNDVVQKRKKAVVKLRKNK